MSQSPRRTFNIVLLVLAVLAGVALAYTAVGQLWPRAGADADLSQEAPDRIAGPINQEEGEVTGPDTTTLDAGRMATPAHAVDPAEKVVLALPNGTQVTGTAEAADLQAYLASSAPAGRRFSLNSVHFVARDEVRQDPDGALSTLTAILNAYPESRVRIEVIERNPQMNQPHQRAFNRASNVATALVANGLPEERVTFRAVKAEDADLPRVEMVVTEK